MGRRCWQPLWFPLEEGTEEHRNLLGGGGAHPKKERTEQQLLQQMQWKLTEADVSQPG